VRGHHLTDFSIKIINIKIYLTTISVARLLNNHVVIQFNHKKH